MSPIFDFRTALDCDFEPFSAHSSSVLYTTDSHTAIQDGEYESFKQRIEYLSKRYLNGQPLFIQTASLRGPFDSTWRNPWTQQRAVLEPRSQGNCRQLAEQKRRRQKDREKEDAERLKRARILQADGFQESLVAPVDLTKETHQIPADDHIGCDPWLTQSDQPHIAKPPVQSHLHTTPPSSPTAREPSQNKAPTSSDRHISGSGANNSDISEERRVYSLPTPSESDHDDDILRKSEIPRESKSDYTLALESTEPSQTVKPIEVKLFTSAKYGSQIPNSRAASRSASFSPRCTECDTQTCSKWYRSSSLCDKCYRNVLKLRKQAQGVNLMIDNERSSLMDRPMTRLAMSQPEPITTQFSNVQRASPVIPASFSQPVHRSRQHKDIFKQMFPVGVVKDAEMEDSQLFALMGSTFKPRWYPLIRKRPGKDMICSADTRGPTMTEARPKTGKAQRRLVTFDTPVIKREGRKKRTQATHRLTDRTNQTCGESDDKQVRPSVISTEATGRDNAIGNHAQSICVDDENTEGLGVIQQVAVTPDEHGVVEPIYTPISQCQKSLFPAHANMLQSVEEHVQPRCEARLIVRNLDVAERHEPVRSELGSRCHSDSIYDSSPRNLLEIAADLAYNVHSDIPLDGTPDESEFQSTQAAMVAAQEAFQEALISPEKIQTQALHHGSTPLCNITPFHNVFVTQQSSDETIRHLNGQAHLSEQPTASTQALFSAFVNSPATTPIRPPNPPKHTSYTLREPLSASPSLRTDPLRSSMKTNGHITQDTQMRTMNAFLEQAGQFLGDWDL